MGFVLGLLVSSAAMCGEYGRQLACVRTIDKPGVMDAVVSGKHLFFIGSRHLYVADITDPSSPQLIGDCSFRGKGRQLAIADGIAYVTARDNGVYIIDVHDPRRPEMLCHYDCIELATGVEVQGDLLFIAQRQYGVEIVNIANPRQPVYVGRVKTGEKINTGVNLANRYSFFAGITSLGDRFLCTCPGGYRLVRPMATDLESQPLYRFDKRFLGKPSVFGKGLFLASRVRSASSRG